MLFGKSGALRYQLLWIKPKCHSTSCSFVISRCRDRGGAFPRVIGRRSPDASGPTLMPLSASGPQNDLCAGQGTRGAARAAECAGCQCSVGSMPPRLRLTFGRVCTRVPPLFGKGAIHPGTGWNHPGTGWNHPGATLEPPWNRLEPPWNHPGTTLEPRGTTVEPAGTTVEPPWNRLEPPWNHLEPAGTGWNHLGTTLEPRVQGSAR